VETRDKGVETRDKGVETRERAKERCYFIYKEEGIHA
jgi:hypothetical protein